MNTVQVAVVLLPYPKPRALNPFREEITLMGRIAVASPIPPREKSLPAILIVDDDPDFRQLLVGALSHGQPLRIEEVRC